MMNKTIFDYIPYSEIKREKKRQEFREKYGDWMYGDWQTAVCNLLQHRQLEEAQERVKELEAALRPFAEITKTVDTNGLPSFHMALNFLLPDELEKVFRQAYEALAAERPEAE